MWINLFEWNTNHNLWVQCSRVGEKERRRDEFGERIMLHTHINIDNNLLSIWEWMTCHYSRYRSEGIPGESSNNNKKPKTKNEKRETIPFFFGFFFAQISQSQLDKIHIVHSAVWWSAHIIYTCTTNTLMPVPVRMHTKENKPSNTSTNLHCTTHSWPLPGRISSVYPLCSLDFFHNIQHVPNHSTVDVLYSFFQIHKNTENGLSTEVNHKASEQKSNW